MTRSKLNLTDDEKKIRRKNQMKEWRKKHPNYFKEYYINNYDKIYELHLKNEIKNAESLKIYRKEYYEKNHEKMDAYHVEYVKKNKKHVYEMHRIASKKRRLYKKTIKQQQEFEKTID